MKTREQVEALRDMVYNAVNKYRTECIPRGLLYKTALLGEYVEALEACYNKSMILVDEDRDFNYVEVLREKIGGRQ